MSAEVEAIESVAMQIKKVKFLSTGSDNKTTLPPPSPQSLSGSSTLTTRLLSSLTEEEVGTLYSPHYMMFVLRLLQ